MPFPKPHMDREKSERWIRACRREGFGVDNVTKHIHLLVAFNVSIVYMDKKCTSNFLLAHSNECVNI